MFVYKESNKFSSKIKSLNLKSKFPLRYMWKRASLPFSKKRAKIIYIFNEETNLLCIPFFLRIKLIIIPKKIENN